VYLVTEVAGQSQATLDAKRRDLQRFLTFYRKLYNHDRPDEWFVSVTKAFLDQRGHLDNLRLLFCDLCLLPCHPLTEPPDQIADGIGSGVRDRADFIAGQHALGLLLFLRFVRPFSGRHGLRNYFFHSFRRSPSEGRRLIVCTIMRPD
jgi:hypothetical protein